MKYERKIAKLLDATIEPCSFKFHKTQRTFKIGNVKLRLFYWEQPSKLPELYGEAFLKYPEYETIPDKLNLIYETIKPLIKLGFKIQHKTCSRGLKLECKNVGRLAE